MDRRKFLIASGLVSSGLVWGQTARAADRPLFNPDPASGWRIFEVTSRLNPADKGARVWLPLPSVDDPEWIRPMGNLWQGNATKVQETRDPVYHARMLSAHWDDSESEPQLEIVSRFAVRDRAVDLTRSRDLAPLDTATRETYTRATRLLPTDGIVKSTAEQITRGADSDLEKARAIYDWVVDATERDPKTEGCGLGDIRFMLETGNLKGKCADLNALFVGLCRAVGLPARDVYGVRVAKSRFGYKSLGSSGDISKAQHCRAEVWLADHGWVPADPADVRKVLLQEGKGLTLQDEKVIAVRRALFGAWETNWLAYNYAHDIDLPGSNGAQIPYLMYPQGESARGRFNSLDPSRFRYSLTARELTA